MSMTGFICPVCRLPLETAGRTMRCGAGHSFDVAREGYVNLLTGKGVGAMQGDNAEMVRARRGFLERGYYAPLADAVAAAVTEVGPTVVADFGCGEGYYLRKVISLLELSGARAYGTDISKAAVSAAARAGGGSYAVADTKRLIPLADGSVDAAINVFAPRNAEEFARVIRSGGRLVAVIPGAGHLADLRETYGLIGIEDDKLNKISVQLASFELIKSQRIAADIELGGAGLRDLLEMTPNSRHLTDDARSNIAGTDSTRAHIEFEILIFTRR